MTATLADVAARAKVSPATVSRVLNGNYPVAATTRERVLRAVEELDYVLNGPASALAAATSDLVGILVNDIADPFFGIMAGAVQSEITGPGGRAGGERLAVVCNTGGSPERELTYLTLLQRQRAAAVVLTGGTVDSPEHTEAMSAKLRRLAEAGTRVVLCGRPPVPGTDAVALTFDNVRGGRMLTEHLLALGHRRIGYVAGPAGRTTTRERLAGHRAGLAGIGPGAAHPGDSVAHGSGGAYAGAAEYEGAANGSGVGPGAVHVLGIAHSAQPVGALDVPGVTGGAPGVTGGAGGAPDGAVGGVVERSGGVPEPEALVVHGAYDRQSGYDGAVELLRRDPGLTALVAANDTVALGACAALRDHGLRIPQDVSVAGFDDLPFSVDAVPALTTVRLPLSEAGARAGRIAMGREAPPPGGIAKVRGELMVRGSTAAPRQ
ncbi:LacI family DNA-binding transcriptional regulator [Streptomyces sp. NPDC059578]|uniref:LacI family DNA-binding transcriptional regulator n=1 Tax=Streptomyces sp. NPDC059578 TaxID=3346874 RepID=UPI003695E817